MIDPLDEFFEFDVTMGGNNLMTSDKVAAYKELVAKRKNRKTLSVASRSFDQDLRSRKRYEDSRGSKDFGGGSQRIQLQKGAFHDQGDSLRVLSKSTERQKEFVPGIQIAAPFKSPKDLFCLRLPRTTDGYRKVSINKIAVKVNGVDPYEDLTIRVYPLNPVVSELRFWHKDQLVDIQTFKNSDLRGVSTFQS